MSKKIIQVKNIQVSLINRSHDDYISLTDIARYKNPKEPKDVVKNWLRNRNVLEFLGLWEKINNPNFKGVEFDAFRKKAGLHSFTLSPKTWIKQVQAIGIWSKAGKGGGTFAHKDIAFEFASWISPEFKLYLIKEFQRLKEKEAKTYKLDWNVKRMLAKINYKIHTDAVKSHLVPKKLTKAQVNQIYADEADIINLALFGLTASQWRKLNPKKKGNIRDHADIRQLICLVNLESFNAELIRQGVCQVPFF